MRAQIIKTNLARREYWAESEAEVRHGFWENDAVCLFPRYRDQTFLGFGGAFTEAAAYTWQTLQPQGKAALMEAYFGKDGLRYTLGRAHMGSCDFALGNYACLDAPEEAPHTFHMERDRQYLLPMLREANTAAGGQLGIMLSPWSPPAFMKTNGEMNQGGALLPEYRSLWAQCMARYVSEYRAAGADVRWVSVQNEPDAAQPWDSCLYSAEEEGQFAADFLRPALERFGLHNVEILLWDHNKDQLPERVERSLSQRRCREAVGGAAFHWYSGDHFEAVDWTHRRYPELKLFFAEGCVEYSRFSGTTDLENAEMYAHDIIGNLNAGTCASMDWNLLLDERGGPNHAGNLCRACVMRTPDGDVEKKGAYFYIGHFSRYISPGAVRIGLSRCRSDIEATAFENPDGAITVALLNRKENEVEIKLRLKREAYLPLSVRAHEIVTVLIPPV